MSLIYEKLRILYHSMKRLIKIYKIVKNKLFSKIDKKNLKVKFAKLGLKQNIVVYVHSSLSSFGYVEGGPKTVIDTLMLMTKNGTIMMPTFTHPKKEVNLNTKCWTGKIAETFRNTKNVKRSIHPSHSIACYGKYANYLTKNHENSKAPFDENSPFSKFAKLNSYILMIGTENNSMIHYVQNKVNFPNLFLKKKYKFKYKTDKKSGVIETKLHHPKGSITYIYKGKQHSDVQFLTKMYKDLKFEEREIMKTLKIGNATCHLIKTKEFVKEATEYLKDNVQKYKKEYSLILKNGSN